MLEKIASELARLKAWRFGTKTEAMNAQQRQMFDEAVAEDEASRAAQLRVLHGATPATSAPAQEPTKRQPRRQALPEHLKRVEHHHEPESTTCAAPCCGQPMVPIGEDVQERHASSAGRILRAPSHPQQVGLQVLQDFGAGASTAEGHRQGDAGARSGRPHADQPLR